jgi:phytoene synthase
MNSDSIAILSHYGRTFRLAGRFLPRADLEAAAILYSFCRQVDDLADEASDPLAAQAALATLCAALRGDAGGNKLAAQFAGLAAAYAMDREVAAHLVETVRSDMGPVRIADEAALLRYAYGAAGTVGLMMCDVLRAADPKAKPFAIDLGIAMQLTNIARDVVEDAARDRLYLPAAWLPDGMPPAAIADHRDAVFDAVQRVLSRADQHYRSAELGYRYLPRHARLAIGVAGRLYEEIGVKILRTGPGYLTGPRSVVSGWRKALLFPAIAVASFKKPAMPHHGGRLQPELSGLPGIPG